MKKHAFSLVLFVFLGFAFASGAHAQCYLIEGDPTICDDPDPGGCDPTIDPTCGPLYCDQSVESCTDDDLARRNGCIPGTGAGWARCQFQCQSNLDDAYHLCDVGEIIAGPGFTAYCKVWALRHYRECTFNCDVECQS